MNRWPSRGTALFVAFGAGVFLSAVLFHLAIGAQSSTSVTRDVSLAVETATHLAAIRPHVRAGIDGWQETNNASLPNDLQVTDSFVRLAPDHAEQRGQRSQREHELFDQLTNSAMETMQ